MILIQSISMLTLLEIYYIKSFLSALITEIEHGYQRYLASPLTKL